MLQPTLNLAELQIKSEPLSLVLNLSTPYPYHLMYNHYFKASISVQMVYSPLLNHSSFSSFIYLFVIVPHTRAHMRVRTHTHTTTDLSFVQHSTILGMSLSLIVNCK